MLLNYEGVLRSQDISVSTVTELLSGRSRDRSPIPDTSTRFLFSRSVQNDSGANAVRYSMGTVGTMPGQKRPGRRAHHSSPSNAYFKNE